MELGRTLAHKNYTLEHIKVTQKNKTKRVGNKQKKMFTQKSMEENPQTKKCSDMLNATNNSGKIEKHLH